MPRARFFPFEREVSAVWARLERLKCAHHFWSVWARRERKESATWAQPDRIWAQDERKNCLALFFHFAAFPGKWKSIIIWENIYIWILNVLSRSISTTIIFKFEIVCNKVVGWNCCTKWAKLKNRTRQFLRSSGTQMRSDCAYVALSLRSRHAQAPPKVVSAFRRSRRAPNALTSCSSEEKRRSNGENRALGAPWAHL